MLSATTTQKTSTARSFDGAGLIRTGTMPPPNAVTNA
jgi:hypothetical protein